jgi:hypothetical protein
MRGDKKRVRQSFPRRKLRAELRAFLGQQRRALAFIAGAMIFTLLTTYRMGPYVRGLAQATYVLLFVGMALFVFAIRSQAWNTLCGAWAEDNTRDAVDEAQKKRLVWCQVSSIESGGSDIDHVVIAPGGILMLESKWSFAPMTRHRAEIFASSTLGTVRRLGLILRSQTIRRHRDVTPVVVVWGKGGRDLPAGGLVLHGVHVMRGDELTAWLSKYRNGVISRDWADETAARLERFADGQTRRAVVVGH